MAKTVKEIVAHIQGSAKSNPKSYSKEYEKFKKNLAAQEAKPKNSTSAEKKQNIQFKKETAEFEKVTDVPTGSEIFADQAERIRDLYSQQQRKDVQRKKDEQEWAKVEVDSAQLKKEQAEKALADFEQKSDIDWTDANARKRYGSEMDRRQAAVDRANEEIRQREEAEVTNADVQELASWSDEDKALLDDYISKRQSAFVQSLNPAASGLPADFESNPLIAKYGRQRLDEIASTYQRQRNQEKYQAAEQAGRNLADTANGLGGVPGSILSVGANLADTLLDPLARIAQGAGGRDDRYSSLDPYAGGQARAFASGVRQETAQNIEGEDPTALSKGLSIGYQGMMSAADSLARGIVGGSPTVGAGLAALGSFNQTLSQASARGASPQQAVALATVNAGIEAATEKIPLDELFDIAKGGAKPAGQAILNVLKQMGIEATTEELSLLGATLAEAAILREKSGHKQQIADMIANGMSYQEAKEQANKAWLEEAKQTALVSGVAGIFGGAGAELGSARFVGQDPVQMTAMELAGNQQPQTAPAAEEVQPASFLEASAQQFAEQAPKAAPVELTPEQQMLEQAAAQTVGVEQQPSMELSAKERGIRYKTSKINTAILNLVDRVKKGVAQGKEKVQLGTISDANAAQIQRETGIDTRGYYVAIEARQIEHILNRHGENGAANRSMANPEDIARIEYALNNPDRISKSDPTRAYVTNRDGQMKPADTVLYETRLEDGSYYVVQAVPETKKRTLYVVSAFIGEPGYKNEAPQSTNAIDPGATPEAESTVTSEEAPKSTDINNPDVTPEADSAGASTDSVPQNINKVNGNIDETSAQDVDILQESAEDGQVQGNDGAGTPEQNFSGKADYQQLLQEGNVQPDRPGDVRPMEVPKSDGNGKRVTEFAADAYGAGVTTDEMASTIESLIQDGQLGFDVRTNRESLDNATAAIKKRGVEATKKQLTNRIDHKKIQDGDIEQGILLYAKYAEKGDNDNASEMLVDLAQMANITGRNLQMFKLLRRMTVEGQVMTLQKEIQRSAESMIRSGQVKKGYEPSFDPQLMEDYRKALEELRVAKTPEAQETAKQKAKDIQDAVYAAEAAKMPATFKAKWDAWRYMAMLGNVKTQVRNLAGNALFEPYKATKDKMAALFEKALPQDQRTKALIQDPGLLKWARTDAKSEDVHNALKYSAKLGDDVASQKIAEQTRVFDTKALEAMRKLVEKAPQAGDLLFKNDYYARSLAGFLKARGYTAAQIQSGQVDSSILNEGRSYAVKEAMKATFNDCNQFSDMIASMGYKDPDNAGKKIANAMLQGIMPFRRTPANIAVRFKEYSPVEIFNGLGTAARSIAKGDVSAATAIDQVASGLTGTAAMALGWMLSNGIGGWKLTGSGTDEDEKRQGHQDYALEISVDGQEYSYKIDWAAPANMPLFVGANICQMLKDRGGETDMSVFTSLLRGMYTSFEPMLALSCLSSVNDFAKGLRYARDGEELYTAVANLATSYFTQGIPALARQAYQATQENKQTTFANDEDPTIRDLQKTAANIPFLGAEFQTDKINAWGETENQGNWMERTFNAFVNPGTKKAIENGPLEQEINRLNEAQTESVTPPTASKTLSYTDKQGNTHKDIRLTEEQYQTLAKTQGQTAKRIVESMISSKDYAAMTDEQKAKAIQQAYQYARKTGEIAAIGEDHTGYIDAWMMEMTEGKEAQYIMNRVTASELSGAMSALDTAWDKSYDDTGRSDDLKWAYDTFKAMSPKAKQEVKEWATGTTAKYIEARESGVSHTAFTSAAESIAKVKGTGSNGSVRDIDRREAIATTKGLSQESVDKIMKCYMTDYDPNDSSPSYTELKYDYIREGLGLSPQEYAQTYRVHLDNSKKADKIAAMMDLGYDKKTATALYNVYASTSKGKDAYMGHYEGKQ